MKAHTVNLEQIEYSQVHFILFICIEPASFQYVGKQNQNVTHKQRKY